MKSEKCEGQYLTEQEREFLELLTQANDVTYQKIIDYLQAAASEQ